MPEEVVLVNENDERVGTEEKLKAHQNGGKRHRAFSIFVFNSDGEMLLQKRAEGKYHCPGLWTNTTCSHPRPEEDLEQATHRRIQEEMGFDCPMEEVFTFHYEAEFENGLTENEMDHVFVGKYDGEPDPNPDEAGDWKWEDPEEVERDVENNPDRYTPWFRIALDRVIDIVESRPDFNVD
ncbi:MAG: isopentenyl-diphosphate Delta-isomerase [Candidatus Aenigmatarchaeota archaeon]